MDTVGSFGRTVADAVHGLNAIVGQDDGDAATCTPSRPPVMDYSECLNNKASLKGAKFGLPIKRCWDQVSEGRKQVATRIFDAIRAEGGDVIPTDFPCAEERIPPDGAWNWSGSNSEEHRTQLTVAGIMENHRNLSSLSSK